MFMSIVTSKVNFLPKIGLPALHGTRELPLAANAPYRKAFPYKFC